MASPTATVTSAKHAADRGKGDDANIVIDCNIILASGNGHSVGCYRLKR